MPRQVLPADASDSPSWATSGAPWAGSGFRAADGTTLVALLRPDLMDAQAVHLPDPETQPRPRSALLASSSPRAEIRILTDGQSTGPAPATRPLSSRAGVLGVAARQPQSRNETALAWALAGPAGRELLPQSVTGRLTPLLGRDPGPVKLLRGPGGRSGRGRPGAPWDRSRTDRVLRQRDPGFVPAVAHSAVRARAGGPFAAEAVARALAPAAAQDRAAQTGFDGEGLAEHVERLVQAQVGDPQTGPQLLTAPGISGLDAWGACRRRGSRRRTGTLRLHAYQQEPRRSRPAHPGRRVRRAP